MAKAKFLDFKLFEEEGHQIKFRFYPRQSNCHSFGETPPTNWDEIYKVYYSWRIDYLQWNEKEKRWIPEMVMDMPIDECSVLTELAYVIRWSLEHKESVDSLKSCGMPGSEWDIDYRDYSELRDDMMEDEKMAWKDKLRFRVFDNYTNRGYQFFLEPDKAEEFAKYLDRVNDHMLKNGEPI